MMRPSDPLANEKLMTPITITNEQNHLSAVLVALISPYPTVVMVVIVQTRLFEGDGLISSEHT